MQLRSNGVGTLSSRRIPQYGENSVFVELSKPGTEVLPLIRPPWLAASKA